jgi:cation:H+ antiporter
MSVATSLLAVGFGLVALGIGAESLVRGGVRMARNLGVTPLAVGLTVVAYGTSAPEMMASVIAGFYRHPDITLGNVVGSNIANIGLILGVTALLAPFAVPFRLIRREIVFMFAVTLLFYGMAWRGTFTRGAGVFLLVALGAFNVLSLWWARREPASMQEEYCAYEEETVGGAPSPLSRDLALVALGLGLLFAGGHFLVTGAVTIARKGGVSEIVIGLTLVALGTSLPELATSIVAALRKEGAICVGNLVGSNLFNILGAVGLSASIRPFPANPSLLSFEFPSLLLFTAAMGFVLLTGKRVRRGEGAFLLAGYILFMALLLLRTY